MKKLLSLAVCLILILSAVTASFVSASAEKATSAEQAEVVADTGAEADLQETAAVTPVNLGDSFYARLKMVKYKDYYMMSPSAETGAPILRKLNEYYNQLWHFTREGRTYRIRSVSLNRYIEMSGSEVKEGGDLFHATKRNSAEQKWIISKDSTGYRIHSSVDENYVLICVNPTASTSIVRLTASATNARAYFSFEKINISSDLLDTPAVKLSNHVDGVMIDWNDVKSATQYRVYRYNDSTKKWNALADVRESNYIDTKAKSGSTYKYTVKVISPTLSKYTAQTIKYIAAPLPKVNNTADGPSIYWSKCDGAEKYRVFYHNGTKWVTLGNTTATSFLHKGFEYNKEYKYTVRCLSADGKAFTSAYYTNGVVNKIVKTPTVKAALSPIAISVTWNKIDGAVKYRVYHRSKATNLKWAIAANTADTSYTFNDVANKTAYCFTVRALDANNNVISGFLSTKALYYYEAPVVFDIKSSSSTRKLSWYAVDGVAQYRVFAWNGKKWLKKGDTSATSFNADITGTADQNLCYAVRCMDKNGNYISSYLETVNGSELDYYFPGQYSSAHKF